METKGEEVGKFRWEEKEEEDRDFSRWPERVDGDGLVEDVEEEEVESHLGLSEKCGASDEVIWGWEEESPFQTILRVQ